MRELIAQAEALEADLAAAQSTNESWIKTVREIGHAVNCLYSTFPDANGHIVSAIQKLKADLAAAQAERDALFRSKSTLNTRVLAAEAEVQALRVDAERYQHIRLGLLYQGPRAVWFDFETGRWEPISGEHLDRRTDQAIEARKEGV